MTELIRGKRVWSLAVVAALLVVTVLFSTQAISTTMTGTAEPLVHSGADGAITFDQDWSGSSAEITRHESSDLVIDASDLVTGVTIQGTKVAQSRLSGSLSNLKNSSGATLDSGTAAMPLASGSYSQLATMSGGTTKHFKVGTVDVVYSAPTGVPQTTPYSYYKHSETQNVGGTTYYQSKGTAADGTATTLSSTFSAAQTGRVAPIPNNGMFVYPLTCISSLPAETWTATYWVRRDDPGTGPAIAFDAASSGNIQNVSSLTISHTVANQSNRLLVVNTFAEDQSATDCNATSVTYNSVALTEAANAMSGTTWRQCVKLWYLLAPDVGTYNIVISWAGPNTALTGGGISLYNVKQQAPPQREQRQTCSSPLSWRPNYLELRRGPGCCSGWG